MGGEIQPLMRINEVIEEGMIPPHLNEDILTIEEITHGRLFPTYNNLGNSHKDYKSFYEINSLAREDSNSPDYVDMTQGSLFKRYKSEPNLSPSKHNKDDDNMDDADSNQSKTLGRKIRHGLSRKFKEARQRIKAMGRRSRNLDSFSTENDSGSEAGNFNQEDLKCYESMDEITKFEIQEVADDMAEKWERKITIVDNIITVEIHNKYSEAQPPTLKENEK